MANVLGIGCVGTSSIMELIIGSIRLTGGLEARMIYSRDIDRGRAFALKTGVPGVCDDFEAMLADPAIDVVYIASPNYIHARQAVAALNAGKHVIVEKPACVTENEAVLMHEAALKNDVFFFEATTTLWMPNYLRMKALLPKLGKISSATLAHGQYSSKYDAYLRGENPNILNPEMKTGALNDMGIYCVHAAVDLWGEPDETEYSAEYGPNGIDLHGTLRLRYGDLWVDIISSKCRKPDGGNGCRIHGENGAFLQTGMIHEFTDCAFSIDGQSFPINEQTEANRMVYEHRFFRDCILNRDTSAFETYARQTRICAKILEQSHINDAVGIG